MNNRFMVCGLMCAMFTTLGFVSCRKDKMETPQNPGNNNTSTSPFYHLPLTSGSYWIYQQELTDSLGNITGTGGIDSTYVAGDTTMGSNIYKKIITTVGPGNNYFATPQLVLQRDSAGYHVNQFGVFIEHNNFTDTLHYSNYSGMVDAWYFMRHPDSTIVVPAGTFQTVDYEGHMYATDPNYNHPVPRYTHTLFADNIGMVTEVQYFYSQAGNNQRRLIRYHIQ